MPHVSNSGLYGGHPTQMLGRIRSLLPWRWRVGSSKSSIRNYQTTRRHNVKGRNLDIRRHNKSRYRVHYCFHKSPAKDTMLRQTNYPTCTVHMLLRQILIFSFNVRAKSPKRSLTFRFSTKFSFSQLIHTCNVFFPSHRPSNDYPKNFGDADKWGRSLVVAIVPDHLDFVYTRTGLGSISNFSHHPPSPNDNIWEQQQRKAVPYVVVTLAILEVAGESGAVVASLMIKRFKLWWKEGRLHDT